MVPELTETQLSFLAAGVTRGAIPSTQKSLQKSKLRLLYFFSAAAVVSATALLFFVFQIESVRAWISSWLYPSLQKIQGFLGLTTNGDVDAFQLLLLILSLSSLVLIPSIVENVYLLIRRKLNQ